MERLKDRKNLTIGILGMLVVLFMCSRCGSGKPAAPPAGSGAATADTANTEAPAVAMDTEVPATDEPTDIPATEVPVEPIHLEGSGQTATDPVDVGFPAAVASLTHNGSRNFIVHVLTGDGAEDSIVNEIGPYSGQVLVPGPGALTFDVKADGAWTIDINPAGSASEAAFSGKGDAVSGLFDPPENGAWEISHDGESNFMVHLVCGGDRSRSVQNEIGPVTASAIVKFGDGPCLWTVHADGNWTLAPRQ